MRFCVLCYRFVFLILFLASGVVKGQESLNVSCKVLDATTRKPLSDVYVAINNTSRGTSTSRHGKFSFFVERRELGNDMYLTCAGYYDTLIPCRKIVKNNINEILLRPLHQYIDAVDVVAEFNKDFVFGDTAYIFSDKSTSISKPYYMEYSNSIGCLFINKHYGIIDRVILNLTNDGYHNGKFAIRLKKISPKKHYVIGWRMLNKYEDLIKDPIIIQADNPGVIDIDLSAYMAFVPAKNNILLLIYPLERMENYTIGCKGRYIVTSRVFGNTNAAIYPYPTIRPNEIETVFLMNNECVISKVLTPPQMALIMKIRE